MDELTQESKERIRKTYELSTRLHNEVFNLLGDIEEREHFDPNVFLPAMLHFFTKAALGAYNVVQSVGIVHGRMTETELDDYIKEVQSLDSQFNKSNPDVENKG